MEINPVMAYIPLNVYNAKFELTAGDVITALNQTSIEYRFVEKVNPKQIRISRDGLNFATITISNNYFVRVKCIRVVDIPFKYIEQSEINFGNGKSI